MKQKIKKRLPIERLTPDPNQGLTSAQARERAGRGWANDAAMPRSKSVGQIIRTNTFTFFNLIFCVLAACIIFVGSWHDLLFMIIVVLNTLIGIVQEIRAKSKLDKLTLLTVPAAAVIRDGKMQNIPVGELVLDDIVKFSPGNQVSADAVVCAGEAEVNESLLTGEADPVLKKSGDTLLSGSFLVAGQCRARLDKVGADSYAAQITREARKHKKARSEMMASLDRLIQIIGIVIVPFGLILFFKQWAMPEVGLRHAVISSVASAVGMIPEGLYLLTSVALAVGVINLAKSKTLVHELTCIETLARVDVLCLDKTGTITQGDMEVLGYEALDGCDAGEIQAALEAYCFYSTGGNVTARALLAYFGGQAASGQKQAAAFSSGAEQADAAPEAPKGWTPQKEIPFSSSRKWGCIDFGEKGVFALGAPECILGDRYESIREQAEALSRKGLRVLLLAKCPGPLGEDVANASALALISLSDKIRPSASKTFAYFQEQDVEIKVISGDNPVTVSQAAFRAGVPGAKRYTDAQTLKTQEDFAAAAKEYAVFGRVKPDQKRKLIAALKAQGHTVAMTGDGVNDVLALKDADCSVAMASGSEAAANVSQLVLLDSDFSSMPKIVNEGRRVINNIERSASLFLVKNIFSFLVTLFLVFLPLPYPFAPIQLTLVSSLTIGFPAFVLALEPTYRRVSGHFMENVLRRALPGGLTNTVFIMGVLLAGTALDFDLSVISAICTAAAGCTGLAVLFAACRPFNLLRKLLWAAMCFLFAAAFLITWPMLVTAAVPAGAWPLLAAAVLLPPPVLFLLTRALAALLSRRRK